MINRIGLKKKKYHWKNTFKYQNKQNWGVTEGGKGGEGPFLVKSNAFWYFIK